MSENVVDLVSAVVIPLVFDVDELCGKKNKRPIITYCRRYCMHTSIQNQIIKFKQRLINRNDDKNIQISDCLLGWLCPSDGTFNKFPVSRISPILACKTSFPWILKRSRLQTVTRKLQSSITSPVSRITTPIHEILPIPRWKSIIIQSWGYDNDLFDCQMHLNL